MIARISLCASFLAAFCNARTYGNVTSRLMIHIPHSLFKAEGYNHREALFGVPPYGGSIAQTVYYADSDLCEHDVDTSKGYPARDIGSDGKMEPWKPPYILMVDRGRCNFVKKVRNAQRSGASAVIIADTTCQCYDTECTPVHENDDCETGEPVMADDGSGSDVSIPSFLMFKRDADKVKDELTSNRQVQMEMSWELPRPDDRVEYDLWTIPTDRVSKKFLLEFQEAAVALDDRAYFTPHMYIYDGVMTGCLGQNGENMCYTLCTNNGRYCATDPDYDLDRGISGADVVTESLRRLCIWKHYGEQNGIGVEWWNYVFQFEERCNNPDYFNNEECVRDAYKNARIDAGAVDQCMRDSGGLTGDTRNSYLESEIDAKKARGVVVMPAAYVNNAVIRGALTVSNVFGAICAGFEEGTIPAICQQCVTCPSYTSCIREGFCHAGNHSTGDNVSTHTFALTMLLTILLFSGLGVWHWKRTREDMREQVRGILADYMPLDDEMGSSSPAAFAEIQGNL